MIANVHAASERQRKRGYRCRAFLNGVEVSRRCYYADSKRGFVRLLKLKDGRPYFDRERGDVAREQLHGQVRLVRTGPPGR